MSSWPVADLERLELLVPEIARDGPHDLRAAALTYVDRYAADVWQLGQEWQFLYAALDQAWRRADDGTVVRLVSALAHPAGRLADRALAEQILTRGIDASRRLADRSHLAAFLNRQGGLLFARGQYTQGQQLWWAGLELSAAPGCPPQLWEPFASFAHSADILGNYPAAEQFVASFQTAQHLADPDSFAVALFVRGFYARVNYDLPAAQADMTDCLRLLALHAPTTPPSAYRQMFSAVVHAELARTQGDYPQAQHFGGTAFMLAQIFGDRFTQLDLLVDQMLFAHYMDQPTDTRILYDRLSDWTRVAADPIGVQRCNLFAHLVPGMLPPPVPAGDLPALPDPLSAREIEVLELVAAGLASGEIAIRLVVTPGTVKKHLEHIYGKLDVHSRTAALARARALHLIS